MLPLFIVEEFLDEKEKHVFLYDCYGRLFMFEIDEAGSRLHLTTGWKEFMLASGATDGDFMVFNVTSKDHAVVSGNHLQT